MTIGMNLLPLGMKSYKSDRDGDDDSDESDECDSERLLGLLVQQSHKEVWCLF